MIEEPLTVETPPMAGVYINRIKPLQFSYGPPRLPWIRINGRQNNPALFVASQQCVAGNQTHGRTMKETATVP